MPKSSRRRLANPLLPGASPGARSISGPSSNSKTAQWHCVDRGAIPRGSTIPSRTRKTAIRAVRIGEILGAALSRPPANPPCPFLLFGDARPFQFRQSVVSDARRWYRRETGASPVGGSYCPVAQHLERPALTREVDGANPSGAAIFHGSPSGSQALQRCSGLMLRHLCG